MSVHLAIIRRARPGCESEFEHAVREFFRASITPGVQGVHLVSPPPGSGSRDYGILRSFASEAERTAFYRSPEYLAWEQRAQTLTEGPAQHRVLHGLEAWFRGEGSPPPRWKMAVLTFAGVYVVTLGLSLALGTRLKDWPLLVAHAAFNLVVVTLLTWAVMPALIRLARPWLHPSGT